MTDDRTVAVIGMGPRGTSVFERLVAHANALPGTPLTVHLIDPHPAGPGQIWRTGQSRLLLMNTQPQDQTIFPDESLAVEHRDTGPDMGEWVRALAAGEIDGAEADRDEARCLTPSSFPSRALYGAYLRWAYERIAASALPHITIVEHRTLAIDVADADAEERTEPPRVAQNATTVSGRSDPIVAVWEGTDGVGGGGRQRVVLADGGEIAADDVVLALGHIPARLNPAQRGWRAFAEANDLTYSPPSLPADVDWDSVLPAGETVILRGFALNFFDIMALATIGRGGEFHRVEGRLEYRPSGREPVLVPGSRGGVPYRAKPIVEGVPRPEYRHRHITAAVLDRLLAGRGATGRAHDQATPDGAKLAFDRDVWPLILRDALTAYYETLARVRPEAFARPPRELLDFLAAGAQPAASPPARWDSAAWAGLERAVVPGKGDRFDLDALLMPLDDRSFDSPEDFAGWLLGHLDADIAEARAGADSPVKMAALAIYSARELVKFYVADGLVDEHSYLLEIRGWFEDFAQAIGSGPPLRRIEEVAALARAGVLRFVGPEMHVGTSGAGDSARFVASSPRVRGSEIPARVLAEAMAPGNRASAADDALLRGLLDAGRVRPRVSELPEGIEHEGTGLDVTTPRPHRALDDAGRAHPRRYVIGLLLSSVEWGTAIAAQPRAHSITLRDADAIARAVLKGDR